MAARTTSMTEHRNDEADVVSVGQLPRELWVCYVLASLLYAPVFQRNFFELPAWPAFLAVIRNFMPFVGIPAVLHPIHALVMKVAPRYARSVWARFVVHATVSGVVAGVCGVVMFPAFAMLCRGGPPRAGFVCSCVVMTWTMFLPALLVQDLRIRNETTRARLEASQRAALHAQIEALQSRTQPHFLFNALNTIACLVREDADAAERTIERLAVVLRHTLKSARSSTIALKSELEMVVAYLEIQKARFDSRLVYSIEIEPGLEGLAIPPLTIQPLVENAVQHGVARCAEGGAIAVTVRRVGSRVEVRIASQLRGEPEPPLEGTGTSLLDLRRRLELLYGDEASLHCHVAGGGSVVDVSLPWRAS